MPRTPYEDDQINTLFTAYDTAKKKLAGDMTVDNYTNGLMSTQAASQAQSVDYQVRKQINSNSSAIDN